LGSTGVRSDPFEPLCIWVDLLRTGRPNQERIVFENGSTHPPCSLRRRSTTYQVLLPTTRRNTRRRWLPPLQPLLPHQGNLPFPLATVVQGERRRRAFPAAISSAPFLFGGWRGFEEGNGPGNRCAAVYRVGGSLPRSRVCSPYTDSGARVRWGVFFYGVLF
jgi:hypothetical protein